ncbi:MAG: N,N-dimethylformamidase [Alphaproteobacteria bacterium]|nr:N,N-dimethylformamidase [Alphaproteobacteria bacterium]
MASITGYSDKISVQPGETIDFKVSAAGMKRYRAEIVRVISGDDSPKGPGYRVEPLKTPVTGTYPAKTQPIHAGSYAIVPPSAALDAIASFTLQAMVMPTLPAKPWQSIMGRWVEPSEAGFFIYIDDKAQLCVGIGDGRGGTCFLRSGKPMLAGEWYLTAATFDAATGRLELRQVPQAAHLDEAVVSAVTKVRPRAPAHLPFLIAAWSEDGRADGNPVGAHFNGRIDDPVLCRRALSWGEIAAVRHGPLPPKVAPDVVAAWDFAQDIASDRIRDASPNRLDGRLVNLPTRAVRDSLWTGEEMNWRHAPGQYGAIHFHDSDLYDCGWRTDFSLTVPAGTRSGFYAARLSAGEVEEHIPFFVRPKRGTTTAKLCFLVPTASYMAYANGSRTDGHLAELIGGQFTVLSRADVFLNDHPEYGHSCYDNHSDGSGVSISSRLRPILNMRPRGPLWEYNADTHVTAWLEARGIPFDVVTDEDLHAEGVGLLAAYPCVMTGTHPEYYSKAMLDALEAYTGRGGRLIYLGANGFYWRIAYHPELPGVLEMRRAEDGSRAWAAHPGEYYMSFTGEYGGMWRRSGRPPQALVGTGFIGQGFDLSSYYVRTAASHDPRAAFIFKGIGKSEKIGDFGILGGGAAGWELDWYDVTNGSPPHALIVARSVDHSANYQLVNEEVLFNYPFLGGDDNPNVHADMVFFETAGGGAVFSTSSIAWAAALPHNDFDNNVGRITENVIRRFTNPKPFKPPG